MIDKIVRKVCKPDITPASLIADRWPMISKLNSYCSINPVFLRMSSMSISEHLKWCNGHSLLPCNPHGLHSNFSEVSRMIPESDNGPKPNSRTVEQKRTPTGAFEAEAKCAGAESFVNVIFACWIKATDCKKLSFPADTITPSLLVFAWIVSHKGTSSGPPIRWILYWSGILEIRAYHFSTGHILVNQVDAGAIHIYS